MKKMRVHLPKPHGNEASFQSSSLFLPCAAVCFFPALTLWRWEEGRSLSQFYCQDRRLGVKQPRSHRKHMGAGGIRERFPGHQSGVSGCKVLGV